MKAGEKVFCVMREIVTDHVYNAHEKRRRELKEVFSDCERAKRYLHGIEPMEGVPVSEVVSSMDGTVREIRYAVAIRRMKAERYYILEKEVK